MMSVVELSKCAICGSRSIQPLLARPIAEFIGPRKPHYSLDSLGLTGTEVMGYVRCRDCSFIFASPTLDEILEEATYNEAKDGQTESKKEWWSDPNANSLYQTHHKWVDLNPFVLGLGLHFRRYRQPHNPGKTQLRLLDIGCGFGHTLELARVFGIHGTGCEIDQSRLAVCRKKGLHAVRPEAVKDTFDIVISSNVIEHVYDLRGYIEMVRRHLGEEGVFVFNGLEKSVIRVELRLERFKLLNPIEHRNVLTRQSLSKLLGDHGLRLLNRGEVLDTMKRVRSRAPLYLPYLLKGGFFVVNGVFSAIAKRA